LFCFIKFVLSYSGFHPTFVSVLLTFVLSKGLVVFVRFEPGYPDSLLQVEPVRSYESVYIPLSIKMGIKEETAYNCPAFTCSDLVNEV